MKTSASRPSLVTHILYCYSMDILYKVHHTTYNRYDINSGALLIVEFFIVKPRYSIVVLVKLSHYDSYVVYIF